MIIEPTNCMDIFRFGQVTLYMTHAQRQGLVATKVDIASSKSISKEVNTASSGSCGWALNALLPALLCTHTMMSSYFSRFKARQPLSKDRSLIQRLTTELETWTLRSLSTFHMFRASGRYESTIPSLRILGPSAFVSLFSLQMSLPR